MRVLTFSTAVLASLATIVLAKDVDVKITRAVECERKSQKGDKISVHYRGTFEDGGKQFDASYDRGQPLDFVVGQGSVIKGWDDNLIDMCIGEKRTLTIPPEHGYGEKKMGPIPGGSTLIFETELIGIAGVEKPESIVEKSSSVSSEASETASSLKDKATGGVKEAIKDKVSEAAEALKVTLQDSDGDGQEHNEL